jgi:type VI secretion system secreted protein VgrG
MLYDPMATLLATFSLSGEKLPADAEALRYRAEEAVSVPYTVDIELTTADVAFRVEDCLRTRVALTVVAGNGLMRIFDGIVDEARFVRVVAERRTFAVRLRPMLAALAHRAGCRIFQDLSIVAVVQTLFQEAGFADRVEWRLTESYPPREFVVQYRESHLDFVSRLLEDSGLFYWFVHDAEGHKMIIADDSASFSLEPDTAPAEFSMAQGGAGMLGSEPLGVFSRERALSTSQVHLVDYDFVRPAFRPDAQQGAGDAWPMPYFEYPAGFTDGAHGAARAKARLRELRANADTCHGQSRAVGLRVGSPFTVDGAAEECLAGAFVVTSLVSRGAQGQGATATVAMENEFRGIPEKAPFAAPRRTPRPRIPGVQTAIVTGSSEQEQALHVDEHGRIKVRFYWDRLGQQDHTSSCWVRVSQMNMGGSIILPRVGWEVSVAFIDGDPDRPVVLGRVYNAEKVPPVSLPGSKASGSLKSMSSPGAGGHNELTMADDGGSQGFGMHAQKDLNVTIGHDKIEEVAVDEAQSVTCNGSSSVGVDEATTIAGDQSLEVGAVHSTKVSGAQSIDVGGSDTSNAISNHIEKVEGARAYTVGGTQITISNGIRQSITGSITRKVGAAQLTGAVGSINDNIIGALSEKVGAVKVQLVNGSHGEQITGDKKQTYAAAELHMTKGGIATQAGGSVTNMVGGLHYQNLAGDYVVKANNITLLGAVGVFKGGGSEIKLGGGPVVIKGSKVGVKGMLIVKLGASMKLGS